MNNQSDRMTVEGLVADVMAAVEVAEPSDYRSEGLSLSYGQVERGVRAAIEASGILGLTRERDELREATTDALAGWRYIREHHGDLYGVGWDRVEQSLSAALGTSNERAGE
jgi:hypothetical protein